MGGGGGLGVCVFVFCARLSRLGLAERCQAGIQEDFGSILSVLLLLQK